MFATGLFPVNNTERIINNDAHDIRVRILLALWLLFFSPSLFPLPRLMPFSSLNEFIDTRWMGEINLDDE